MNSKERRLSILLLADDNRSHANTVLDHIAMFTDLSRHKVSVFNPKLLNANKWLTLDEFDVVVIHYSLFILGDAYLSPFFREKIRNYGGLKVQFLQDDYRWVDSMAAMMRHLGIHLLFTLYPADKIAKIWHETRLPGVQVYTTLAGYIPDNLVGMTSPSIEARPIDIGYRGRALPFWLGELAQEKVWIAQGVLERAPQYDLVCDIAWREDARIYGASWNEFIASCKAMLGTESGASITDFDGTIQRRVDEYLVQHPETDFFTVQREVLAPYENNLVINVISPRMFEAIALRTALILFPGDYSGILQPWVHYLPLAKDFSNMEQVVEKLRDHEFLHTMTEQAYADVVESGRYSYRSFIQEFDQIVVEHRQASVVRSPIKLKYYLAQIESAFTHWATRKPVDPKSHVSVRNPFYFLFYLAYWLKILLWLLLVLATGDRLLFSMLAKYRRKSKDNQTILLPSIILDLLRLGLIRRIQRGELVMAEPIQITAQLQQSSCAVLFTTFPSNGQSHESTVQTIRPKEYQSFWATFASQWHEGKLKKIVWDHSAGQPILDYPLVGSIKLGWQVIEGSYSFDQLIQLSRVGR